MSDSRAVSPVSSLGDQDFDLGAASEVSSVHPSRRTSRRSQQSQQSEKSEKSDRSWAPGDDSRVMDFTQAPASVPMGIPGQAGVNPSPTSSTFDPEHKAAPADESSKQDSSKKKPEQKPEPETSEAAEPPGKLVRRKAVRKPTNEK